MEMKNEMKLLKRLDEHECVLMWSASSPAAFIASSIEDFKAFISQKISEMEEQAKAAQEPQSE